MKSRIKVSAIAIFAVACLSVFFVWQNNDITVTHINYSNEKVPDEYSGFRITHISDLHNKSFGKDQKRILRKIGDSSPDIIVITGDLIDRRKYDLDTAMTFIKGAVKIAPIYYVSGNHEAWSGDYENISRELLSCGVNILDDKKVELKRGNGRIEISGLSDPGFTADQYDRRTDYSAALNGIEHSERNSIFQILLFHRPEYFELFADKNINMIFSGHAHGGQIRLPFIGAVVAPGQGFFPEYTSGLYTYKQSAMVVSRGLGNSIIPIRVFNRPEIVVVTLHKKH